MESRVANAQQQANALESAEFTVHGQDPGAQADRLPEVFNQFVGETFFGMMIKSMRATTDKPAYFHGGRAEEMWTSQLDQHLSENLARESASQFSDPMFELFNLPRS